VKTKQITQLLIQELTLLIIVLHVYHLGCKTAQRLGIFHL
jgi:hypothetical protein